MRLLTIDGEVGMAAFAQDVFDELDLAAAVVEEQEEQDDAKTRTRRTRTRTRTTGKWTTTRKRTPATTA